MKGETDMDYARIEFYWRGRTHFTDYNVDPMSIRVSIDCAGEYFVSYSHYYELNGKLEKTREKRIIEKDCSISVLPNCIIDKNDIGKVKLLTI